MHFNLKTLLKLISRHKKKTAFLLAIILIYQLGKRGALTRLLSKAIGLIQSFLVWRMKKEAATAQTRLILIAKSGELIEDFKRKTIMKATTLFSRSIKEDFSTGTIYEILKRQGLDSSAKVRQWNTLQLKIHQKMVLTLLLKGLFDFNNFAGQIVKAKMEAEVNRRENKKPEHFHLNIKDLENSDVPIKEEAQKDLENGVKAIQAFIAKLNEDIFRRFCSFLQQNKEFDSEFQNAFPLNEKLTANQFIKNSLEFCKQLLQTTSQSKNQEKIRLISLETDSARIQLSYSKNSTLKALLRNFQRPISSPNNSLFFDFLQNYQFLRADSWQESELQAKFCTTLPVTQNINLIVDLLTSEFFASFHKIYTEYLQSKLYNRLLLVYKKELGEESLFEPDAAIFYAKLLSRADQLLEEEFYLLENIKIDQEMLLKKIKLAIYLLKINKQLDSIEQSKEKIAEVDSEGILNQSMICGINLESLKVMETTGLFLQELVGFEMSCCCLKDLARQLLI